MFNPVLKWAWRVFFGVMTWYYPSNDIALINVGYADLDAADGLVLKNEELRNCFDRYRLQLYHHLLTEMAGFTHLSGQTILETACGRGGGLNYIVKYLRPQYAIGVDICSTQVLFSSMNLHLIDYK